MIDMALVETQWIFNIKHGVDGCIEKYKERFVAKGFSQKEGIEYEDTLSPLAKYTSTQAMISLLEQMGWHIHQMYFKMTFQNGELEDDVYIEHLEGFVALNNETHVCRLKRYLYGLKKAPRVMLCNQMKT